jgi:hypothetical protein
MRRILLLTTLLALVSVTAVNAAVITILNNDGPGEGFNDPTPAAPVGGNPGVTIGQQRLNVFQHAADIWGGLLPSVVTIVIRAQFNPQTCTPTSAVLGSAGPSEVFANFTGALIANTWYHVALANKLGGVDLNPGLYDINATFNSNLNGDVNCLGGRKWYYGYDGLEGTDVELLPVVLHEMGHGLGFSTLVGSNGAEMQGIPDLYERYIRDNTLGMTWDTMTQAQRAASAINTGNVVWNGPCVTAHSPEFLGGIPTMFVNSGALPPKIPLGVAGFGPQTFDVTGDLVLVDDGVPPNTDACTPIVNNIAGLIAVLDRGTCTFAAKAAAAQAAGAIAVVVVNNVASATPPALGGSDPSIVIPVVSVTLADGNAIKAQMLIGTVNVTLGFDLSGARAGADLSNRVKLYAPNPYEGGSSISHFDVSALPNLLMEPAINNNLHDSVDLTFHHFTDLGWLPTCEPPTDVALPRVRGMLAQNQPNPFNPTTTIRYTLPTSERVGLAVYSVDGTLVRMLVDAVQAQGDHDVTWDGRDSAGNAAGSGVYFYRLTAGKFSDSKKMVLLK